MYAKDPNEPKYQFLINKRKSTRLRHFNDPKVFIENSNDMQGVHKNVQEYNIVFDYMISDMISNKKLNPVVTELFIRGRKLKISIVFITQSSFKKPKDIRLNSIQNFIIKIPNKKEMHQIE